MLNSSKSISITSLLASVMGLGLSLGQSEALNKAIAGANRSPTSPLAFRKNRIAANSRYVKRVKPAKSFLTEADKTAIAKAEAKRAMRAAKLLKTVGVTL